MFTNNDAQDELLGALSAKQPKLVASAVTALKEIVRLYGTKTVQPKPILKSISKIFGHSDKNVRAEVSPTFLFFFC